jgi:hypothetical protein
MTYYYIGGVPYNSRQWSIIIVTSFLVATSTLAVGLRLYARQSTGGRLHLDDICIVASLVSGVPFKDHTEPRMTRERVIAVVIRKLHL